MRLTVPVNSEFGLYIIPEKEGNKVTLLTGSYAYKSNGKYYDFYSVDHPCKREFRIVESSNDDSKPIEYRLDITFQEGLPFEKVSIMNNHMNHVFVCRTVTEEELKAKPRETICG